MTWEVARLLACLPQYEQLGLALQRLDYEAIIEECDKLIATLEPCQLRVSLKDLKAKALIA